MKLANEIREKALLWSKSEIFDQDTRQEVQDLFSSNNETEITNRFYKDLEFGTGGMRGLMGAGTARFNIYNVRRASQALALYLREIHGEKDLKVALSYDSRTNSRLYVEVACEVLAEHKIHCVLTRNMRPVPMLSFMVRHFHCNAGVCITASHNPAPYNGYKIYWESGGQLTPPHDQNILKFYMALTDYSQLSSCSFGEAKKSGHVVEIEEELDSAYFKKLHSLSMFSGQRDLKIVYSPLHGTGIYAVPQALSLFGFNNLFLVSEQSEPDGRFPTVVSPNPEDPRALELAMKLGVSTKSDLVLATDPDADRLAVVVREKDRWTQFTGNQMGALLFNYILSMSKAQNRLPVAGLTIKTVVTSDLLKDISNEYGVPCEDVLTGFKWICDRVEDYESGKLKPYREFICGAEESYGFLAGTFVRDKDAILSSVMAVEMLAYYKSLNKTLSEVLDEIFLRHGVYHECLETLTLPGKEGDEKIRRIMDELRRDPPARIGTYEVQTIKDYLERKTKNFTKPSSSESRKGLKVESNISLPISDVLQFCCDGAQITIRPSGTEPKIKIYLSVFSSSKNIPRDELPTIKKQIEEKANSLMSTFLTAIKSIKS